jgi:hypothetical protein
MILGKFEIVNGKMKFRLETVDRDWRVCYCDPSVLKLNYIV